MQRHFFFALVKATTNNGDAKKSDSEVLAAVMLTMTKATGETYTASMTLHPGESYLSAALTFMMEHNVNVKELSGLATRLQSLVSTKYQDHNLNTAQLISENNVGAPVSAVSSLGIEGLLI